VLLDTRKNKNLKKIEEFKISNSISPILQVKDMKRG